jgi:hypothetical protein
MDDKNKLNNTFYKEVVNAVADACSCDFVDLFGLCSS